MNSVINKQPHNSKTTLIQSEQGFTLYVPPKKWGGIAVAIVLLMFVLGIILISSISSQNNVLFYLLLIVECMLIPIFLISSKGRFQLILTKEKVQAIWFLGKLKQKKEVPTRHLKSFTEEVMYNSENEPSFWLELASTNNKPIKFGKYLDDNERRWLVFELEEIRKKLQENIL